jgi:hypothetical protein
MLRLSCAYPNKRLPTAMLKVVSVLVVDRADGMGEVKEQV